MTVAFAIIAHDNPTLVARVARRLLDSGGLVAIHYDARTPAADFEDLQDLLSDCGESVLWAERVAVAWGQWSMVRATLNLLEAVGGSARSVDHVHLMSGADYPIAPLGEFQAYLDRAEGREFIQCHDPARWIVDGLAHQRWQYRHYFNFKTHPLLFHYSWHAQRLLRLRRRFPRGYIPQLGSQWWTLTWETCTRILEISRDARLTRFFERTWIPDEMYIQTLVANFVPRARIAGHALTLHQFTDYGVPVVFTNGHEAFLSRQPFFFARKISPYGDGLRNHLDRILAGTAPRRACAEHEIGHPTAEYERRRRAGAKGRMGRRVMGFVTKVALGDLEWNLLPYVVVIGFSRRELTEARRRLEGLSGLLCHGEVFDSEAIEFAHGEASFAGLSRDDIAIRDHKRGNALVQILQESPDHLSAVLLRSEDGSGIADSCLRDPNARVVFVFGDPVAGFLAHNLDPETGNAKIGDGVVMDDGMVMDRFASEYGRYVRFHQRAVDHFVDRHETRVFDWSLNGQGQTAEAACPEALCAFLGLPSPVGADAAEPDEETREPETPYGNLPLAADLYAIKAAIERAAGYAPKAGSRLPKAKGQAAQKDKDLWFEHQP